MSLLSPLFLLGLLALALPFILHRFSHHEPPKESFPSSQFLEASKPPATRKKKLRYWSLLSLRTLFLLALCFLFAEPLLNRNSGLGDAKSAQLIVVDTSFSMQADNRWQRALAIANEEVSGLSTNSAIQLFSFATQLTQVTELGDDSSQVTSAINALEPSFESADYGALMRALNKVAADINMPVAVTFISDAQRSNLPAQINALHANRLTSFRVLSVVDNTNSSDAPLNFYLSADARTTDSVTARVSVLAGLSATDIDSSSVPAQEKNIEVLLNDRVVESRTVVLNVGESETVQLDGISLPASSNPTITVRFASNDDLADDDQMTIPVRGLSTVDIGLASDTDSTLRDAFVFLKTAIETDGEARVERLDYSSALAPSRPHAIVVSNSLTTVPAEVERFVLEGGNALLIPADARAPSTSRTAGALVAAIDEAHPLALGDLDWFSAAFYDLPPLQVNTDDLVLITLSNNQPLLVEKTIPGGGRLLVLNDPLNGTDSDLPLQPVFVDLMQQIIAYFEISNALPASLNIGQSLQLPANTQLLAPNGSEILSLSDLGSSSQVTVSEPGVYTVLGSNGTRQVLAKINTAESNLIAMSEDDILAWENRHARNNVVNDDAAVSQQNATELTGKHWLSLWPWLLPVVLVVLAFESILANRMLWVRRDGY